MFFVKRTLLNIEHKHHFIWTGFFDSDYGFHWSHSALFVLLIVDPLVFRDWNLKLYCEINAIDCCNSPFVSAHQAHEITRTTTKKKRTTLLKNENKDKILLWLLTNNVQILEFTKGCLIDVNRVVTMFCMPHAHCTSTTNVR